MDILLKNVSSWLFSSPMMAILIMAIITFALRAGGFSMAKYLPKNPITHHVMEQMPAIILVSLIAPSVVAYGTYGLIAASVAAILAYRPGGLLPAMIGGSITIALLRIIFGA
ncbi:MAG: AzlD domain-containing protein [Pseudomonadota bacterium]